MPIITARIQPDSVVYTDSLSSYGSLSVAGYKHFRINHSKDFVKGHTHINGIENFWNQAKRHLRRFNGLNAKTFPLYLKECEWRFNGGSPADLLKQLKRILGSD